MSRLSRSVRTLSVLTLACGLAGSLALTLVGPAQAAAPATAAAAPAATAGDHLHFGSDTARPAAGARGGPLTWQRRTIYYYETMPAAWDWSLSTAVAKWNTAGGSIRFVRVAKRARAQLTIGFGNVGAAAGMATVGPTRNAWVRLNPAYRSADATDAHYRIEVMAIFTHELGHVLGFDHTSTRCALMGPVLDVAGCGVVTPAHSGYYKCQTIDRSLVNALVRRYGGRARTTATPWCLIDPMPPVLSGVTFSGGVASDEPVTIRWGRPSGAPSGSRVLIHTWGGSDCAAPPVWADTAQAAVGAGLWQDVSAPRNEDACFNVELVNRYGVGRPAVTQTVARWSAASVAPEPTVETAPEAPVEVPAP